jgi:hypothetical protein
MDRGRLAFWTAVETIFEGRPGLRDFSGFEGRPGLEKRPGFAGRPGGVFRFTGFETAAGEDPESTVFLPRIRSRSFSVDDIVSFFFAKAATCLQGR